MKYEYKTFFLPVPIEFDMEGYLNEIGQLGWKVIAATFVNGSNQKTFEQREEEIEGDKVIFMEEIPTPKPFNIFILAMREIET